MKFMAILFVQLVFSSVFARDLPPATLVGEHVVLVGEWVHLDSYCDDWSGSQRDEFTNERRNVGYVEHLFINQWDLKFLQSQIDPATPNRPYDFCEQDIYFQPVSTGRDVSLLGANVSHNHCSVLGSVEQAYYHVKLDYKIFKKNRETYLGANFHYWPSCDGKTRVVLYRKK